ASQEVDYKVSHGNRPSPAFNSREYAACVDPHGVNGAEGCCAAMTDLIWLNGKTLPFADARVGVEDRGFQFADGVYEVIRIYNGKPFALDPHLQRLWNSAVDIQLTPPLTTDALAQQITQFLHRTGMREGMVYLQLTRGVAPRNH